MEDREVGPQWCVVVWSPRALDGIATNDAVAKFAGLVQLQRQRLERRGWLPNPAKGVEVGFRPTF